MILNLSNKNFPNIMIKITFIITNHTNNCLKIFFKPFGDITPPLVLFNPTFPSIATFHSFLYNPIPPNNIKNINISNILIEAKLTTFFKKSKNLGINPFHHTHVPIRTS